MCTWRTYPCVYMHTCAHICACAHIHTLTHAKWGVRQVRVHTKLLNQKLRTVTTFLFPSSNPPGVTRVFKNWRKKKERKKVELIWSPTPMGEPPHVSSLCTDGMMMWVLKQKALQRPLTWLLILGFQFGFTTNALGDLSSTPLSGSGLASSWLDSKGSDGRAEESFDGVMDPAALLGSSGK